MKSLFIILLTLSIIPRVYAQLAPLPNSSSESWYDKIPVSGEIRTGIMIDNSCTEKVKNNFFVEIPMSHNSKFLTVEISSNDGRYNYVAEYEISNIKGITKVQRITKFSAKLSDYKCNDLAIMAWLSDKLGGKKDNFVLANWDSNFDSENAIVLLNSENPAVLFVSNKKTKKSMPLPCKEIKNAPNVAYNCKCELPVSEINSDTEISIVQRVRRSQNRYSLNIIRE